MPDISYILIWWLLYFAISTVFLPVTFSLFKNFADRGYIFSRVIGTLLSAYAVWILGSLHILAFGKITIVIVLIIWTIFNLWIFKDFREKNSQEKLPVRLFILEEILFFVCLAFWAYIRAFEPSIRGLEKFMDFGFMNSILRADYFPPLDMWLSKSPQYNGGYFINYYYFGHYIMAYLTKLSGLDPAVTYNLMLASLFAFTFTLSFSIGLNLYHLYQKAAGGVSSFWTKVAKSRDKNRGIAVNIKTAVLVGLLAGFLVAMGGNPHTLYSFTAGYPNEDPVPPWKLEFGYHPERYWYPNATRFIPFTIHEFPIYSFVVADIHGHVSDIPFVLTTIALLLSIITSAAKIGDNKERKTGFLTPFLAEFEERTCIPFPKMLLLGILLGVLYMTNAWDGLIYMIFSGLVFLYLSFNKQLKTNSLREKLTNMFYNALSASLFLLFFFLITSLPFSLSFKPFVSGIGVLCAPSFLLGKNIGPILFEGGKCQKSPLYMLVILWGFFYFAVIGYLFYVIIPLLKKKWALLASITPIDFFVLIIIFISSLLLIFPEFFYIKDIYPAHYRANTMFKLGYQAFMMLGLVSAYSIFRIKKMQKIRKSLSLTIYNTVFIVLFTLVAIYPYFAIASYYGNLRNYQGLYGLNWLQMEYLDDYNAVVWLNRNVSGQPVIVEANGDSYTNYDRVSANTGLPTIVGWPVHEWLWRGSYDEAGKRIPEVAAIYESEDLDQIKEILKKYKAEYIFLGSLEREKYKNLKEENLQLLGKVVFESGGTKIFKVN